MYFFFFILLNNGSVYSATWYVDKDASGSSNGTSWANAWTSVGAISGLSAGDTVYFSGGSSGKSYTVSNWTPTRGTAGNPITYAAGQDTGYNGMVTFTGSGNFLTGVLTGVTINGEVSGQRHITVAASYDAVISSNGSTNGFKLLYVNASSPSWPNGTGFEIAYSSFTNPPDYVGDNFRWLNGGMTGTGYTSNLIHHNFFQTWRRRDSGQGQDHFYGLECVSIYNNSFVTAYKASWAGTQHGDGIQVFGTNSYVAIYNNYFEGMPNYPIYLENNGGIAAHWRIYNNVFNNRTADAALIDWGAHQDIAIGMTPGASGGFSDIIIANNTHIGYHGTLSIHFNTSSTHGSIANCYIVNNLLYDTNPLYTYGAITISNNTSGGTSGLAFVKDAPYPENDYHLTAAATNAIDKGISPSYLMNVYTTDKVGTNRPQGAAWDIGAYEATSTSTGKIPNHPTSIRVE